MRTKGVLRVSEREPQDRPSMSQLYWRRAMLLSKIVTSAVHGLLTRPRARQFEVQTRVSPQVANSGPSTRHAFGQRTKFPRGRSRSFRRRVLSTREADSSRKPRSIQRLDSAVTKIAFNAESLQTIMHVRETRRCRRFLGSRDHRSGNPLIIKSKGIPLPSIAMCGQVQRTGIAFYELFIARNICNNWILLASEGS
ncbi:hypothetical protein BD414DRAFT_490390 [Trametes punicea]|nr:hypothetical protein BD414DRAFT_490390 [Trametes punicea]